MQRKSITVFLTFAVSAVLSLQAFADTTPEDAKDYRAAIMTSLRGHIGAASMITRGLVENDGHLVSHAEGLAASAKELDRLFPAGSDVGESESLPLIWEEPEAFAAAIKKLQDATAEFVTAAKGGDAETIGAAFRNVGMSCRGCHDRYRESD
jgi:cytochrome c556